MITLDTLYRQMNKDLDKQKKIVKDVNLPDILKFYHKGKIDILKKYLRKTKKVK